MIGPLSEAQLTLGCYGTALLLNVVIAYYGFVVAKSVGTSGVFGKAAGLTAGASAAFVAYNAACMLMPASVVPLVVEVIGSALLLAAAYTLYTLVKV